MIRIIAGRFGGRRIEAPRGSGTRPAANAHRESVMMALEPDLEGARVLDLFAGSGAFGIESLSRGAAHATFVERARDAYGTLNNNLAALDLARDETRTHLADAYRFDVPGGPFDIVFVAPPYPHFHDLRAKLLARVEGLGEAGLLASEGVVLLQCEVGDMDGVELVSLRRCHERRYGRTEFIWLTPRSCSG